MREITDKQRQEFIDEIRIGGTVNKALQAGDFVKSNLDYWRKRRTQKDLDFFAEYEEALNARATSKVPQIEDALFNKALDGDFQSMKLFLTNQAPGRWKSDASLRMDGKHGQDEALESSEGKSLDEQIADVEAALADTDESIKEVKADIQKIKGVA